MRYTAVEETIRAAAIFFMQESFWFFSLQYYVAAKELTKLRDHDPGKTKTKRRALIYERVFWAVTIVLLANNILYTYLPQRYTGPGDKGKTWVLGLTIWTISVPPVFFLITILLGLRIMYKIMQTHSILRNERIFRLHVIFFCIFTAE